VSDEEQLALSLTDGSLEETSDAPADEGTAEHGTGGEATAVQSPGADSEVAAPENGVESESDSAAEGVVDLRPLAGSEPSEQAQPDEAADSAEEAPNPRRALYYLTNRMNLNGILSSRVVGPRESFKKYYADLLDRCPGWVPLLTEPPGKDLLEAVVAEKGAGAPVIVEFPVTLAGDQDPSQGVIYLPAVALADAVAIHLRSQRDLREHRARSYGNVHPHDELLQVTPGLYAAAPDSVSIQDPGNPPVVLWNRIDRIRGAVNAARASASAGEQLAVAASFLGGTGIPESVGVPRWIHWLELDDHSSDGRQAAPDIASPDVAGFRAAYDVLGERDVADAWRPNDVLDEIIERIRSIGLAVDANEALLRNLERVRAIVNAEVDFEPFRPSARALVSAKALLLVLLRPDLEQLLAWSEEETGADDVTRVAAAVLAGRLRGLARESVSLRSMALDDMTAKWAVHFALGAEQAALGQVEFKASELGTAIEVDGVELATAEALTPDPIVSYRELVPSDRDAARIKVSRALEWPVEHRVQLPDDAKVESTDKLIVVSSAGRLLVEEFVDEESFISRLGAAARSGKRAALAAISEATST
jgi:hypothetical protein